MDQEDVVEYLTESGVSLEELASLDDTDPHGELHTPRQRTRFWRIVRTAAQEGCLTDSDARWLARVGDWAHSPMADSVREFVDQRHADARDRMYQTRPDPLAPHLARPGRWRR